MLYPAFTGCIPGLLVQKKGIPSDARVYLLLYMKFLCNKKRYAWMRTLSQRKMSHGCDAKALTQLQLETEISDCVVI